MQNDTARDKKNIISSTLDVVAFVCMLYFFFSTFSLAVGKKKRGGLDAFVKPFAADQQTRSAPFVLQKFELAGTLKSSCLQITQRDVAVIIIISIQLKSFRPA